MTPAAPAPIAPPKAKTPRHKDARGRFCKAPTPASVPVVPVAPRLHLTPAQLAQLDATWPRKPKTPAQVTARVAGVLSVVWLAFGLVAGFMLANATLPHAKADPAPFCTLNLKG